jgi:hypothetical protein
MYDMGDEEMLKMARMMYGDRVQMRDADVEHQYRTPYNLYRYLVDKQDGENAMTVDDIVAEFAKTKSPSDYEKYLYKTLSQRKLLTSDVTVERLDDLFKKDPCSFITALVESKLCTSDLGLSWYTERFEGALLGEVIMESGLYKTLDKDEIMNKIPYKPTALKALRDAGLLKKDYGVEWYIKNFAQSKRRSNKQSFYDALMETSVVKEMTFEQCIEHFYCSHGDVVDRTRLFNVMKSAGVLNADYGVQWYIDHFKTVREDTDPPLAEILDAAGLLVKHKSSMSHEACELRNNIFPEDMYKDYAYGFSDKDKYELAKGFGLLSKDLGMDWYTQRLRFSHAGYFTDAIREAGLLSASLGKQWFKDTYGGKSGDRFCTLFDRTRGKEWVSQIGRGFELSVGNDSEYYMNRALYEVGLLDESDVTRIEFLESKYVGEQLHEHMMTEDLYKDVGMSWMCSRYGRNSMLVVSAMKAKGIWDTKAYKNVVRYLRGDALYTYCGQTEEDVCEEWANYASSYQLRGSDGTIFRDDKSDSE